jgi:antirestriction protein ArdC
MSMSVETRTDVYSRVTDRIVAELEKGVRPWMKPWNAEHAAGRISRPLRCNGQAYRGINVLVLWIEATAKGFAAPIWLTFKQAKELGGFVRKGEHGSPVVYSSSFKKSEEDDSGEETEKEIHFLKGYTVFNVEQVEGLPCHFYAKAQPLKENLHRIEKAEAFVANTKADLRYGGTRAYYAEGNDYIQLPPFETFRDAESHAATLAHELTHWTKHGKRLDRSFEKKRWGDEGYAMEELVAELGAAFLCADLAITPEVREDHAAYVGYWLKVLKDDKKAVFTAAAHAQKAADYLHGLQPKADEPPAAPAALAA